MHTITSRFLIEKWYPLVSEKGTSSKDAPSLRIKCKYQTVDILPLDVYEDFLEVGFPFLYLRSQQERGGRGVRVAR